jgi:serine/threonine protein kinase
MVKVVYLDEKSKLLLKTKADHGNTLIRGYDDFAGSVSKLGQRFVLTFSSFLNVSLQHLSEHRAEQFKREVYLLATIVSPNVCQLLGACFKQGQVCIVQELMMGTLSELLYHPDWDLSLFTRVRMMLDAARGLAWLHHGTSRVVVHRDLKPDNLLVDSNFCVKVADFGLAELKFKDRHLEGGGGSPLWMAPELLPGRLGATNPALGPINEKLDVYAFGLILWEAIVRQVHIGAVPIIMSFCVYGGLVLCTAAFL